MADVDVFTWTSPDGTVHHFRDDRFGEGSSLADLVFPVGSIYESETYYTPAQLHQMFGGTWTQIIGGTHVFELETRTIPLPSIAAGGVENNNGNAYDFSDSQFASLYEPIGVIGYGVTGASDISVNRIIIDEENFGASYLLKNNGSSATSSTGVVFQFVILWQGYNKPYRWKRTA